MSDFNDLGPGERIYASGGIRDYSWDEFQSRRQQPAQSAAPVEPVILRRASRINDPVKVKKQPGRKKLSAEDLRTRERKAELRRKRIEEDRYLAGLAKAQRALNKSLKIQQEQTRALTKAARLEEVQRRANNSIANKAVYVPSPTAKQTFPPAGVPPLPGKVAVRIDVKTVIYVPIGANIEKAIANYKHKHGLI